MSKRASLWAQRVARLDASGQSCKEYARQIGVNPNTLAGWRWRLRRRASAATSEAEPAVQTTRPHFVEVTQQLAATLAQEVGMIEIDVHGGLVRVHGPVDADALCSGQGAARCGGWRDADDPGVGAGLRVHGAAGQYMLA